MSARGSGDPAGTGRSDGPVHTGRSDGPVHTGRSDGPVHTGRSDGPVHTGRSDGPALTAADARALQECIVAGGVALFPADTVYGLACDPCSEDAIGKLYELKGRPEHKPSAVLFGALDAALPALSALGPQTAAAARALLPGQVTLLLPNPERRYPLACDPSGVQGDAPLGVRVPAWPEPLIALATVSIPLMQSSANLSGEPPALALGAVPRSIRRGADLVLDGGELPGIASTVVDLRRFEHDREWDLARLGALSAETIAKALGDAARHSAAVAPRC